MTAVFEPPGIPQPAAQAPHWEWMEYAISRGVPEDDARGLTRDQIRALIGAMDAPLTGDVVLERHEQDPETLAARREARRPAWGRSG